VATANIPPSVTLTGSYGPEGDVDLQPVLAVWDRQEFGGLIDAAAFSCWRVARQVVGGRCGLDAVAANYGAVIASAFQAWPIPRGGDARRREAAGGPGFGAHSHSQFPYKTCFVALPQGGGKRPEGRIVATSNTRGRCVWGWRRLSYGDGDQLGFV
jgi:hypothetical protein